METSYPKHYLTFNEWLNQVYLLLTCKNEPYQFDEEGAYETVYHNSESWREMYDDGLDPREAINEDLINL
jgi:hypothetical protein